MNLKIISLGYPIGKGYKMYICEAILMVLIILLGIYVSYTDIKDGIIQNKILLLMSIMGIIINIVYFIVLKNEFLAIYFTNLIIVSIIAFCFYIFHLWAAGDSKLLICINILFPARLYDNDKFSFAPSINAIIYIFLAAYIYIVIDSIFQFIKGEKFYIKKFDRHKIKKFLVQYIISFLYLRGIGKILRFVLKDFYYNNQLFFSFVNIFIILIIYNKSVFKKWYFILIAVIINAVFYQNVFINNISLCNYVVLFIVLSLRCLLSGYNYKEIPTNMVTKGMVLSKSTIMYFIPSKVKGLPKVTYEDMRSRLSQEEVEAIIRWKDSKYGKNTITIVLKIPFAIFIIIGELAYFIVRILR